MFHSVIFGVALGTLLMAVFNYAVTADGGYVTTLGEYIMTLVGIVGFFVGFCAYSLLIDFFASYREQQ
jgi:hypothetical protein